MLVSGVTTQGARHTPDFVTQYRVGYSIDGQRWTIYKENGTERVMYHFFIQKPKPRRIFPLQLFVLQISCYFQKWSSHCSLTSHFVYF